MSSGYGARLLSSRDAQGHSGYFQPGTDSLQNLADVAVGAYGAVSCAHGDDACLAGVSGEALTGHA
jgi:hypothetical protein